MKSNARILTMGTALAMLAGTASATAAQSGVSYYHCHVANYYSKGGKNGGGKMVFYHSALFPAAKGMDLAAREAMTDRFLHYVEANYPAADKMREKRCSALDDKAQAEKIYQYQTTTRIYEHVITKWRQSGR
ncbi:hypothetical protein EB810_13775 [Altererythrobacter sp. FM1]|uniref:hypothetical protein n=1 Tax=Tsuneonella flava TaxID=2055955 RepID=UPI000C7F82B1|nr:hypothetical protein [Tsuneonella flava]ROT94134.1 hypothetical protein EB810_13775 [Altererythrobacter sp. FM1]